jgi:hypothetical protein
MVHAKGIPFPEGMSLAGAGGKIIEPEDELPPPKSEPRPEAEGVDKKSSTASEKMPNWIVWIIAAGLLLGMLAVLCNLIKSKTPQ